MTLTKWLSFSKTALSCVIDSLLTSNFDIKTVNDINKLAKDLVNEETKISFDKWLLNHHLAANQKGLLDFNYDKN